MFLRKRLTSSWGGGTIVRKKEVHKVQVSLDGVVYYTGHRIVQAKDGRQFVDLSICDENNAPYKLFLNGNSIPVLEGMHIGEPLSILFDVVDYRGNLQLRAKEVVR